MARYIKGTFKFSKLKNPDINPKAIADALSAWGNQYAQHVLIYTISSDTAIRVDFDITADSPSICSALLQLLKDKARAWGSIQRIAEIKGERFK